MYLWLNGCALYEKSLLFIWEKSRNRKIKELSDFTVHWFFVREWKRLFSIFHSILSHLIPYLYCWFGLLFEAISLLIPLCFLRKPAIFLLLKFHTWKRFSARLNRQLWALRTRTWHWVSFSHIAITQKQCSGKIATAEIRKMCCASRFRRFLWTKDCHWSFNQ